MLGFRNSLAEIFVRFAMSGIKAIIAGHFKVLFRDMLNEKGNKIHNRESFFHIGIVFMLIVVESYLLTIIEINA